MGGFGRLQRQKVPDVPDGQKADHVVVLKHYQGATLALMHPG